MSIAVDILAFGPHPDDIEIGLGGTLARHAALGHRVGLCDLTRGELGSNGTVEERAAEAEAARRVLGAAWRENLQWPDGGIGGAGADVQIHQAASLIRRARPRTIAMPYWDDRHPDHVAASAVLTRAAFLSALARYDTGEPAWRCDWVCYYFINDSGPISFAVDVSDFYDIKGRRWRAIGRSSVRADPPRSRRVSPLRCFFNSSRAGTRSSARRPACGSRKGSSCGDPSCGRTS